MPKAQREAVYTKVRKEDGFEAFEKLKQDVSAEYKRKVAYMMQQPIKNICVAKDSSQGNFFA